MSDLDRFLAFLAERRYEGLHSHETRKLGISANPSQRSREAVAQGTGIFKARENVGRRPGTRFWLARYAPDFAVPVAADNRSSGPAGAPGTEANILSSNDDEASDAVSVGSLPGAGGESSTDPLGTASLFELPPERPRSAITDKEAA